MLKLKLIIVYCFLFKPRNLTKANFIFGTKASGPYKGRRMLSLRGLVDKTHQISLSKTEKRTKEGYHNIVENPNNNFCVGAVS